MEARAHAEKTDREMKATLVKKIDKFVKKLTVYHPLDKALEKKGVDGGDGQVEEKIDQAIKHSAVIQTIKGLSAQYCAGSEYFRYDPDQMEKFNEMYI